MTAYGLTDTVSIDNVVQVSGTVTVAGVVLSASFPASMPVTQGAGSPTNPWWITTTGSLPVTSTDVASTTSNVTVLTASLVSTTFLAPNATRTNVLITNDDWSSGSIYLKFGAAASTGSYSVKMMPGSYYEVDFRYVGRIDGIWDSMYGTVFITEIGL